MDLKKGFTLIELLVVVAVIGILSAVVLAMVSRSRDKGGDAAIKANLLSIRNAAEFAYDDRGCYMPIGPVPCSSASSFPEDFCSPNANTIFAETKIDEAINAAVVANGGSVSAVSLCSQVTAGGAWAVAVALKAGGTAGDSTPDTWCVDSRGRSKSYTWTAGQSIADSIAANSSCN